MKKFILIAFAALLLFSGCKTREVINYTDRWHERSTIDSVIIQRTDSFIQTQRGDTIFRDRWRTLYKDKVKIVIEKDSVYLTTIKKVDVIKYKWGFFGWLGFGIVALSLLVLIYKLSRFFRRF